MNLTPLKKPTTVGNFIFLNLLYKKATVAPTSIPPKTLVCREEIPIFVVKIESNCGLFHADQIGLLLKSVPIMFRTASKLYHKKWYASCCEPSTISPVPFGPIMKAI
jgi:hypothetical protein